MNRNYLLETKIRKLRRGLRDKLEFVLRVMRATFSLSSLYVLYFFRRSSRVETYPRISEMSWKLFLASQRRLGTVGVVRKELQAVERTFETDPASALEEYTRIHDKYSDFPAVHFSGATFKYLRGDYKGAIDTSYALGLALQERTTQRTGLASVGVRIVGPQWGFNIGHTALLDSLAKLRSLRLLSEEKRVIAVKEEWVANKAYLAYFEDLFNFIFLDRMDAAEAASFLTLFESMNEHVSSLKLRHGYQNLYSAMNLAERGWHEEKRPPLLHLKPEHETRGRETLSKMGLEPDLWFVALHVREGVGSQHRANADADITTYLDAIRFISDQGGQVIRMGAPGIKPLPEIPRVVDYANSPFKSDWMDVYLWASCRFMIGTASGPLSVPPTFGRPVLYTNCPCIGINPGYQLGSLMLPKLYYSDTEQRLCTFREILSSPLGWTVSRETGTDGTRIIDNQAEDILEGVQAMLYGSSSASELSQIRDESALDQLRGEFGDTGRTKIAPFFEEKYAHLID